MRNGCGKARVFPTAMMVLQPRTFDVETTFAKGTMAKTTEYKPTRGPDSSLYAAIWPMVYIIKLFGLAPYDFSKDRLVPSNFYAFFSFLFIAIYCGIVYMIFLRLTGLKQTKHILGRTEYAKVTVNFLVMMHDILWALYSRSRFVTIWNSLQDYDENVRQLGYPCKETKTKIVVGLLLLVNAFIWLIVNLTGMHAFFETWVYNMSYMLVYVGTSISVYKFVGTCFLLGQRFKHLNGLALTNLPSSDHARSRGTMDKKTIESLHNDLMIAGETLASLSIWSLLMWLANLTMHSVILIYFVIDRILLSTWEDGVWRLNLCLGTWVLAFFSQLLILHIACDFTENQANSMAGILADWQARTMRHGTDQSIGTSLHLMCRKLYFSAGGCFNVNLPLLRSIAALLTTYLVILLQLPD